jgi:predicted kinase
MNAARLYLLSGLPGTGKTTMAQLMARPLNAMHLRIDTIEQGLRDLCHIKVEGEGYRLAYRIAKDNLRLGTSVIADAVNPWKLTRDEWQAVATGAGAAFINIEMLCSDKAEHRRRIEGRESDMANLELPAWRDVSGRDYHAWEGERVCLDTAGKSSEEAFGELLQLILTQAEPTGWKYPGSK